jgi:hypothetical protein
MSKTDTKDLLKFLKLFPKEVQEITLWLRDFVWTTCPDCNELIYDNYNALAVGFSLTDKAGDVFCSIAVYSNYVNFGFLRGHEISDPDKILKGGGKMYRYISVKEQKDLPKTYIKKLLLESVINATLRLKTDKQSLKGITLVKSVSAKKRRPA